MSQRDMNINRGTARTRGQEPEHAPIDNPERLGASEGRTRPRALFEQESGPSNTISNLNLEDRTDEETPPGMAEMLRQIQDMQRSQTDLQRNQRRLLQENNNLREQVNQLTRGSQQPRVPSAMPVYRSVEAEYETSPSVGQSLGHSPPDDTSLSRYTQKQGHHRSARFPDPDKFSDGTPAEYDRWRSDILDKLDINNDWFPHERAKCAYVRGRVSGRAADHLIPWIRQQEATQIAVTVNALLQALDDVFIDRNAAIKARDELRTMKAWTVGQDFSRYVADFIRLANVGGMPSVSWKEELHAKVTGTMRIHMARDRADAAVTFNQYVQSAKDIEHDIRANYERAETRRDVQPRSATTTKTAARPNTSARAPAVNVGVQRATTPYRQTSVPAVTRPQDVTCYNCNRPGHYSKDCTQPKAENKATELVEVADDVYDDYGEEQYHDVDEMNQEPGNGQL